MDLATAIYEKLGPAGIIVIILLGGIAVLWRHILRLEALREKDRQYERKTLILTLLDVSGSHKDLVVSFKALKDVLK